jgi:acylphosphatase
MTSIRRRVIISGIVQGVWFRACTKDAAHSSGVSGWVRNLPDGRVEAVFEGPAENVQEALDWCRKGSPGSRVDSVQVIEETPKGDLNGFEVTYARGRL